MNVPVGSPISIAPVEKNYSQTPDYESSTIKLSKVIEISRKIYAQLPDEVYHAMNSKIIDAYGENKKYYLSLPKQKISSSFCENLKNFLMRRKPECVVKTDISVDLKKVLLKEVQAIDKKVVSSLKNLYSDAYQCNDEKIPLRELLESLKKEFTLTLLSKLEPLNLMLSDVEHFSELGFDQNRLCLGRAGYEERRYLKVHSNGDYPTEIVEKGPKYWIEASGTIDLDLSRCWVKDLRTLLK